MAHTATWELDHRPLLDSRRAIVYRPGGSTDRPKLIGIHDELYAVLHDTPQRQLAQWCQDILSQQLFDPSTIITAVSDASYIRASVQLHSLFSISAAAPTYACGAFVLFQAHSYRPVLGVQLLGMEELPDYNAFIGEMYTGVALAQLLVGIPHRTDTYLDCNSVIEGSESRLPTSSRYYTNLQEDYGPVLYQFHRLRKNTPHPPIRWTRGHPDRPRKNKDGTTTPPIPRREWGHPEYGIYIADHLADLSDVARSTLIREQLMPVHLIQIHILDVLRAIPSAGQWLRCLRSDPTIPIFNPSSQMLDEVHFQRYCQERERSSRREGRWTAVQLGLFKPTLRQLNATSWPSKWAQYMRIVLDKLPHGRNIAKGQGPDAPIPVCPLCLEGEDSLEHLTICSHSRIATSRQALFQSLHHEIIEYCRKQDLPQAALIRAREYVFACASTRLPPLDILGGWMGIPVPRFLHFYGPNVQITDEVASGLKLLLPKIMGECLTWLDVTWKLRCHLVHSAPSSASSQSTTQNSVISEGSPAGPLRLRTFHRRTDRRMLPSPDERTLASSTGDDDQLTIPSPLLHGVQDTIPTPTSTVDGPDVAYPDVSPSPITPAHVDSLITSEEVTPRAPPPPYHTYPY